MLPYLSSWLLLVGVFGVTVISPGPAFIMCSRNALLYGRKTGVATAVGQGCGLLVHAAYTLAGLAAIIAKSIMLYTAIKWIGAAYLVWLGVKALKSKGVQLQDLNDATAIHAHKSLAAAWRDGFLTNLTNPKAALFFLALFTQIIKPEMPFYVQAIFGLTCAVMETLWFSILATGLGLPQIRRAFTKFSHWVERVCSAVFILLGIKIVVQR